MKKNKMLAFQMNLDTYEEFLKRCIERKAETEEEKTNILLELVKENKIDSVSETSRTKEQYAKDLSKEFNVLKIDFIEPEE